MKPRVRDELRLIPRVDKTEARKRLGRRRLNEDERHGAQCTGLWIAALTPPRFQPIPHVLCTSRSVFHIEFLRSPHRCPLVCSRALHRSLPKAHRVSSCVANSWRSRPCPRLRSVILRKGVQHPLWSTFPADQMCFDEQSCCACAMRRLALESTV